VVYGFELRRIQRARGDRWILRRAHAGRRIIAAPHPAPRNDAVAPDVYALTGVFEAWLDKASQTLRYELTYSGLEGDVRQGHIHLGQHHVNGGIMVWLCQTSANVDPTGLSPVCPQSGTVTGTLSAANVIGPSGQGVAANEFAEFLAALRAGVGYVNVHSTKFPGGEIRGQVRDD
jgi:hypothetical protein